MSQSKKYKRYVAQKKQYYQDFQDGVKSLKEAKEAELRKPMQERRKLTDINQEFQERRSQLFKTYQERCAAADRDFFGK
ncbi:hypothetical protein KSC_093690 [Ktedonobacter sp. SOSP1-52]|uniref:hypothetical protein n=1 Tax=Ktedonobacter sp. SOSP1-52 TaxID=2778366 RepID=UPI00191692B8|nr:hypothetical protein [Ktedonobacter sp. SOSP1-52]GHO70477.1 hypothetical protein KSC_093690 [Ktedonobacter sp. SOSP1-52]